MFGILGEFSCLGDFLGLVLIGVLILILLDRIRNLVVLGIWWFSGFV